MTYKNMPFSPSTIEAKKTLKRGPTEAERLSAAKKQAAEEKIILEEEKIYRAGTVSVRDIVSPAAFKVDPSFVQIGSSFARTIFVVTYPRYIAVGWSSPLINLNTAFDIGMFFYPVKSEIILKQLKKKVGVLEAQIMADSEKGAPRDPVRETALRDIEKLRDDLTQGIEHFFQYAFYITLFAGSKESLDKTTEEVESMFGSKLIYTKKVFFQAEQGFNSTLPLGNDELMITFNMNSSPIASSFPFISSDLTSDNGILYGINRHNNSLILFDRFSLQNANMVVFATSGAGKSVDYNTEVLIKDANDAVRQLPIGQLIEELGVKRKFEQIDNEMEGVVNPDVSVYTFNNQLKGEWSRVSVAARKITPADMYVFRTASGREINVTGDHNMLVLRNGQVTAVKSHEISEGEFIPLPRSVPESVKPVSEFDVWSLCGASPHLYVNGLAEYIRRHQAKLKGVIIDEKLDRYLYQYAKGRRIPIVYIKKIIERLGIPLSAKEREAITIGSINKEIKGTYLKVTLPITPELMRLLGYIVSEGTISKSYVLITNEDIEVKEDIARCLKILNITYFNRASDGSFVIASRSFFELMRALGVKGKAGDKRAPSFVFNCSNELVAEFLRAYYEGDGGVERNSVTACTKSKGLASDLAYLLLRFGIVARLSARKKTATNSGFCGVYQTITISGQEYLGAFKTGINFVSRRKQTLLNAVSSNKLGNTNVDIIPVQEILRELYELFASPLRGLQTLIDIKNGAFQPSRKVLKGLIQMIEERILRFEVSGEEYAQVAALPTLEAVVAQGNDGGVYNRQLWSTLGDSWRLMKNGEVSPRAVNVLKAITVMGGSSFSLPQVKEVVHQGYKELGLEMKSTGIWLVNALNGGFEQNTDYQLLHGAANIVWRQYQELQTRLPRVWQCVAKLKGLLNADLFWDPIVSIQKKAAEHPYVYDLTVDNEVFLAGHGGLFVHNSYTVKLEVLRSLMLGTDVMIIDPEMEYKHLSDAVGGSYINISLASESKVNPFDLPRPVGEEVSVEDIIRSAVITVKGLVRIMLGKVTTEEDSLIDRALLETYAKKDIVPGADLTKVEPPIMQDFADVLEGMEGAKDILIRIKKYTEGTFAGLLNSPTTVDVKNQLVVFSVRDLEDELRPMAIYTIVNHIWNVVRSESKKRILVIDEAWWLMQHEDSAKFVFALIKRCRKYYLGVTTITQDVNDFLTSPYGQAIVNNSALQLLMKQSPAAVEQIAKVFLLTQGEKYLLLEAGVGEGIFFAGQKHAAIKVVASYTEDQLITTDPRQLLEIEEAKREFDEKMKE